jgi:hypothetical protein
LGFRTSGQIDGDWFLSFLHALQVFEGFSVMFSFLCPILEPLAGEVNALVTELMSLLVDAAR